MIGGDIKDFFTMCPHDRALKNLETLLQLDFRGRKKYILVPKNRRDKARFTDNNKPGKTYYIITTDTIYKFIKWSLQNQYFILGDTVYKQHIGLPMGLGISAPLANILAIIDMENFAKNEKTYKQTGIIRYVDDINMMITYNKEDELNDITQKIFNEGQLFKPPLRLIREYPKKDGHHFLETIITPTHNNNFNISFNNKNKHHIKWNRIRFKKLTTNNSNEENKMFYNKLIATFHRMLRICPTQNEDNENTMARCILEYIHETLLHQIPIRIISAALTYMAQKFQDDRFNIPFIFPPTQY